MPAHRLHGIVVIRTSAIDRRAFCPVCGSSYRLPRRGIPGGALAATAKLYGMVATHIKEKHPTDDLVGYLKDGKRS